MRSRPNLAIAERIAPSKARPNPSVRHAVRRSPALPSASRVWEDRQELAAPIVSRQIADRAARRAPRLRAITIVSALVGAFLMVGSLLAAELGSMLIGLVGSCILFLIFVPFFTAFGGSSALRR